MKKLFFLLLPGAFLFGCRPVVELEAPNDYYNMIIEGNTRLSTIFEGFWHGMNNNYVFWDVDHTDWDAVYDRYYPKFEALGTLKNTTPEKVDIMRGYFQDMLKDIVDGHYSLGTIFIGTDGQVMGVNPADARYIGQFADEAAFRESEVPAERSVDSSATPPVKSAFVDAVKNSITEDFFLFTRKIIDDDGSARNFNVATGYKTVSIGNKDILYFHFSSFDWMIILNDYFRVFPNGMNEPDYQAIDTALGAYGGSAASVRAVCDYSNIDGNGDPQDDLDDLIAYLVANNTGKTADDWFDALTARAAIEHFDYFFDQLAARKNSATGHDVCGAIIDIRGNGGGMVQDLSTLWGRIVPHDWTFAKKKFKSGENRLDYTPLVDYKIYKAPGNDYDGVTDIPLALVVNKGSVSCSEMTALFFDSLPNGYVVGGATWGGMGALNSLDNRRINSGQFSVGNGVIKLVFTPGLQVVTHDGVSYEGKGFPPNYPVPFSYSRMAGGIDDRLNEAIRVVLDSRR
jgi:hypothetical protein